MLFALEYRCRRAFFCEEHWCRKMRSLKKLREVVLYSSYAVCWFIFEFKMQKSLLLLYFSKNYALPRNFI